MCVQGWEVSAAVDMHFFHRVLSEEERLRVRRLELFDEFEVGLSLMGCVYVDEFGSYIAGMGSCSPTLSL